MQEQQVVGLDIGGATLKVYAAGHAYARRFPLWRHPELLADALRNLLAPIPAAATLRLAVTMTGELCDCFETKADGVRVILDSVDNAFPSSDVLVWQTDERFVSVETAKDRVLESAASNFVALASIVARMFSKQRILLIDVGSTTTDIIPIIDGRPAPKGRTDRARLASGELLYQGVERTPVCALVDELTLSGVRHRVMNELFAMTLDAYLLTGDILEDSSETMTADGRAATRRHAHDRLARMVGADRENFTMAEARAAADQVAAAQREVLRRALLQACQWRSEDYELVALAGQGEWLARRVFAEIPTFDGIPIASLTERLGPDVSRCACAYAVAELAAACFPQERR